jgi:hypothetical protein
MPPRPPPPRPIGLRIELRDIDPLIWRRTVVSSHWTLAGLHHYLQWVMGWQDSHAHEFRVGDRVIAPDWWIEEIGLDADTSKYADERRVSVAALASELGIGGEFEYAYDMGDGWTHRVIIETPPERWSRLELPLPACTAGENACPPEDVGGPHAYVDFLAALLDPRNESHLQMLRWVAGVFDPRGFDLNRINRDWAAAKRRRS